MMDKINLDLGITSYRDEKPDTFNIRFTAEFDNQTDAIIFFNKLTIFVKDNAVETE